MNLKEKAKALSLDLKAFDLIGVADASNEELMSAPLGHTPYDYLPTANSVLALGMKVLDSILQTAPSGIYSKHYDTINEQLNAGAYKICKDLEVLGYRSIYFPETDSYEILWEQYNKGYTGFVPCFNHMAAAEAAGLGRKGVCGVVLTPEFGPRQRWISVITELPLETGEPIDEGPCKKCGRCLKACPVNAISFEEGTDVRKCWIHWTNTRKLGKACGLCIKACPVGRDSLLSGD